MDLLLIRVFLELVRCRKRFITLEIGSGADACSGIMWAPQRPVSHTPNIFVLQDSDKSLCLQITYLLYHRFGWN